MRDWGKDCNRMRRKGKADRRRTGGEEEPRRSCWGGVRVKKNWGVYEVR